MKIAHALQLPRCAGMLCRALGALALGVSGAAALAAPAGHAHEHGAVKLDIGIEPGKVSIAMESPLDNLVGFERAPRNDAERKRADAAIAKLKAAGTLFGFDAAAGCTLAGVELASAPLQIGRAPPRAPDEEHADLDGDFRFDCKDTGKITAIDVGLFKAFGGMRRIDVQLVLPKGQMKRTLVRPTARIVLAR
jgi:Protein of unknown function (DUF2796)